MLHRCIEVLMVVTEGKEVMVTAIRRDGVWILLGIRMVQPSQRPP
jgi:hypothetical protein